MAGIKQICTFRCRCPCCHKSLDLSEVADTIFQRVLIGLRDGKRVQINHFGSFSISDIQPRNLEFKVAGKLYEMGSRRVIRFRSSPRAKKYINE